MIEEPVGPTRSATSRLQRRAGFREEDEGWRDVGRSGPGVRWTRVRRMRAWVATGRARAAPTPGAARMVTANGAGDERGVDLVWVLATCAATGEKRGASQLDLLPIATKHRADDRGGRCCSRRAERRSRSAGSRELSSTVSTGILRRTTNSTVPGSQSSRHTGYATW